ncbi:Flocculation suppression protein [Entomophthora muscae]|uniref:Flocculation suppression protein n=1 Tax=Entomophthora muscae TaxID=34485 RepID=A0ACC2T9F8_9FUNG|nr:Flocculation suppression protein [Entomophthora muscae]
MGFVIHSIREFQNNLLHSYFKHQNIESFFRQLNLYGFKRTTDGRKVRGKGIDACCSFKHQYFIRDKPELIGFIKRSYVKRHTKEVKTRTAPAESLHSQASYGKHFLSSTPVAPDFPSYPIGSAVTEKQSLFVTMPAVFRDSYHSSRKITPPASAYMEGKSIDALTVSTFPPGMSN